MSTDVLVAVLGTGGLATIVSAIVAGIFSKRKMGAEATEIITKAAAGVVSDLRTEIERQKRDREELVREHRAEMRLLIHSHDTEMQEVRRVLQLHVAWDAIAIAKLGDLGVQLPPAPPLLPPRQHYPHTDLTVDLRDDYPPQEAL